MTMQRWSSFAGAGLFAGAVAWALHQQAGIIVASWACERAASEIWLYGLVTGSLLLIGALLSALALHSTSDDKLTPEAARPRRFLATVSLMASGLFLFALALQAAAPLFLTGCVG